MWTVTAADNRYDHRHAKATIQLLDRSGQPLADRAVSLRQTSHAFLFGNIGFNFIDLANGDDDSELTASLWADYARLFNATTLPFYLGRFEARRGEPDTARLLTAARFLKDHGQTVKGHPLVWHTVTPGWLNSLSVDQVEAVLRGRIRREVADFAGVIDMWDAINEVVIMPVFTAEANGVSRLAWSRGRVEMIRMAVEEAKATDPDCYLLLNDFDLSSAYECLIEAVLEAGIPIDAIGLQSHMHQGYRGAEAMTGIVERFARFGKPLHLTETSLVSGQLMPPEIVDLNDYQVAQWPSTPEGEARQADDLEAHYRSMLAQPSVKALVYWGLTDAHAWLNAPIGLLRADGSHKPGYDRLVDLIKGQWWIEPTAGRTDADGCLCVDGWLGDYALEVAGQELSFTLAEPGDQELVLGGVA
ncbi:MAG: endo-1,4-beta-xylanase [Propionibacteriaceae bacterium]|nr:endo-1,4-beta-xylanase [Propionibacteriaceae bacterium]